jgi:hypothetical protein
MQYSRYAFYLGKSDTKTGSAGAGSVRSGSARCSSASGTHSSGASEKLGLTKRRCKKKECHSPLGNVKIVTGLVLAT